MKFFLEGEDEDLVERDGESYEVSWKIFSPFYREEFYASIYCDKIENARLLCIYIYLITYQIERN